MTTAQRYLATAIQLILITSSWATTTQIHAEPTILTSNNKSQNNALTVTLPLQNSGPTDSTTSLNPASSPTLLQLQQATISQNPELKARYASAATAQSNIDIAKTGWMPSISANANKTYGRGNHSYPDTNVPNRKINEGGKMGFKHDARICLIQI